MFINGTICKHLAFIYALQFLQFNLLATCKSISLISVNLSLISIGRFSITAQQGHQESQLNYKKLLFLHNSASKTTATNTHQFLN